MLQGKIKKFKLPVNNNIENFMKDINIKKNEYVYGCGAVDIDNITSKADSIINFFNFINESYSNLLLLLCQEGFDTVLNCIRIFDNINDTDQEKIFGCLTILIEKSVDIFKNYFKCLEKCNRDNECTNGMELLENIMSENNSIMNNVIKCLEENHKEYSVNEKKKRFTLFEVNEILISYFNALTFIYINIFNSYYNKNFCKQQNMEVIVNVQRGRKKLKKENEEETSTALKNINGLLNNIILLLSNINFDILYEQVNIAVVDLYIQFFLNIYTINQENNNTFNMSVYNDHISMIVGTLLKLYIKNEHEKCAFIEMQSRDDVLNNAPENVSFFASNMEHMKDSGYQQNGKNKKGGNNKGKGKSKCKSSIGRNDGDDSDDSDDSGKDVSSGGDAKDGGSEVRKTENKNIQKTDEYKRENSMSNKFHSFSFTYIFLNYFKKCTNVNICDALLRVRNTDIPQIIIKEFIDYIKENSLLYLNLSVQTHTQNELINILSFLEYFSKNLSVHLLPFLKDLIDMLGIDIYYIRKSIFDMFKNFITLAKASEEIKENSNSSNEYNNSYSSGKFKTSDDNDKLYYYDDEEEEDEEDSDDNSSAFFTQEEDNDNEEEDDEDENEDDFVDSKYKKGHEKRKRKNSKKKNKSVTENNSKANDKLNKKNSVSKKKHEREKKKKKKNLNKNKNKSKKRESFLKFFPININESSISTYKDIIHKIILEDVPFLQVCFKECLKNRAFIMNVLISRQYDSKLHVRCHLLKVLQELVENNFIPLNYYNSLCLICSERINDKSPLVRQRAFSLLSCIASDVVKSKYVIPLNTNKIKKELNNLNRRKDLLKKKECISGANKKESSCIIENGRHAKNRIKEEKKSKKKFNLSDSDDDSDNDKDSDNSKGDGNNKIVNYGKNNKHGDNVKGDDEGERHIKYANDGDSTSSSLLWEKKNKHDYQSKYDLLIKMYNEVLFISIIVDDCVDLCFKLLYSVIETDQKSSIRFIILAHICGNKKAEEQMNKVWSLIFSNNNSIIEIIISEFVNVNICSDDYRISAFRLINVTLNSKLKDLSCLEKIMECLLMQEKSNVSISKLQDELFNIIFVDIFSEHKNLMIKEGALLLMKIMCYSIHTVNLKKGKKEQYFVFSNKKKQLILLFINQYKDNLHFINLLILILKYNKTNKIIQNLLIILFNLVFDNMIDSKSETFERNLCKNKLYSTSNMCKEENLNNSNGKANSSGIKMKNEEDSYSFYLYDGRNMWFRCCQSIVESMYEHFDDFLLIFTTKIKNILNCMLFNNKNLNDNSVHNSDNMGCKLISKEMEEGDILNKVSCFTLTKFIFVSGHLGLYTYIYAEKIQNKLKKLASKSDNNNNNFGMCTKEEKDREYFDYVVENMIVCNNLFGKKITPLIFLILNDPEKFFNECIIKDNEEMNFTNDSYTYFSSSCQSSEKIYMHYDIYLLVLVCLLTLCKFSLISQKFCQQIISNHVSTIQLIVSVITEENNQIFEKKTEMLLLHDYTSRTISDGVYVHKTDDATNFSELEYFSENGEKNYMDKDNASNCLYNENET
ncbi:hypothetical protein, conserved, partial [Plasmodium malariae]